MPDRTKSVRVKDQSRKKGFYKKRKKDRKEKDRSKERNHLFCPLVSLWLWTRHLLLDATLVASSLFSDIISKENFFRRKKKKEQGELFHYSDTSFKIGETLSES